MLIVKTPFRMSFLGGGTDIKRYYEKYGGAVLSTTFDKYCYHTIRYYPPFFKSKGKLTYSKIEMFNVPDEIEHPAVREALKAFGISDIQITYDADLPARSGLGTSSAFAVGLLNGIHSLRGEYVDKMTLAMQAIHLERDICHEAGGVQDQLACSFGGLNKMTFGADGIDVAPVIMDGKRKKNFCDSLVLFFTGFVRFSAKIAQAQIENVDNEIEERKEMTRLVDDGIGILSGIGDINEFGRLLDYTWKLKKSLAAGVSNDDIDNIYKRAKKAGAIGGKLLGAGGGGFMLFFVPSDHRQNVINELSDLVHVPFEFEHDGTRVIYYKQEDRMRR